MEELRRSYFGPKFPKVNGFYNANLATWVGLNESEETEVKKDIEWLKAEVKSLFDKAYELGKMEYHESEESTHRINSLIDQLDETEAKSKQELIEKWETINQLNAELSDLKGELAQVEAKVIELLNYTNERTNELIEGE